MSIAHIQGTGNALTTPGTSVSATLTGVTVGSFIVVGVTAFNGTTTIDDFQVTDSKSNTYAQQGVLSGQNGLLAIYAATVTSGGNTVVTVESLALTIPTVALTSISFDEYSIGGTPLSFDNSNTNFVASSSTPLVGSFSIVGSDLVVCVADYGTTGLTYTASSTFTLGYTQNGGSARSYSSEFNVNVTSFTTNPGFNLSGSANTKLVAVAFTFTSPLTHVYDSDSTTGFDSPSSLVISFDAESGTGAESQFLSRIIYSTDLGIGSNQNFLSVSFLSTDESLTSENGYNFLFDLNNDSATGLESQYATFSITEVDAYSADSAAGYEGFIVIIHDYDEEFAAGFEASLISKYHYGTDFAFVPREPATLVILGSSSFFSSDSVTASDIQIRTVTPTPSNTESMDVAHAFDNQFLLRMPFSVDRAIAFDTQYLTASRSAQTDQGLSLEEELRINNDSDSLTGMEGFQTKIRSTDSAVAADTFNQSNSIFSTDIAIAREAQFLSRTMILSSPGVTDQATAYEQELVIRLDSQEPVVPADSSMTSVISLDSGQPRENQFRIFLSSEIGIGLNSGFLSKTIISSATTEAPIGQETQLPIILGGDPLPATGLEQQQSLILSTGQATALDAQYLLSSSFSTSSGTTDEAIASEAFVVTRMSSDFTTGEDGSSTDSVFPPFTPCTPSVNSVVDVYWSVLNTLSIAGFLPTASWSYVINPEEPDNPWPTLPVPFLMIEPLTNDDTGNQVGAGRFGLVWEIQFIIHVVVGNILDSSWQDPVMITSYDQSIGPYEIVDQVINVLCQDYPLNPQGCPTLIELPYTLDIGKPYRNKKAGDYSVIPIRFRATYQEILPDVLP